MTHSLPTSFRSLALANLAAQSAEQIALAAVPLIAVLTFGGGPGEVGILAAIQTLPFLVMSIPFGVLADRIARRTLMSASELLRALSLAALLILAATGKIGLVTLAILGFAGALGTVGFTVAAPALVPALVPREFHARANGRLELARSVAFSAGPAVGGALVAWTGATWAFFVATALSFGALVLLRQVSDPQAPRTPTRRRVLAEIREGVQFVWTNNLLRPLLLTGVAWNIAWFVLQAAYVPYAIRVLGLSPQITGLTLGCYGAGMFVGAAFAPRVISALAFGRAVQFGPAVSVLAACAMIATLLVPTSVLAGVSFFLFGAGPIVWTVSTTTLRQAVVPGAMLGRVGSVFLTANAGARPLGAALGAAVGALWGEPACMWIALAGFVIQALIVFMSTMNGLQRLPAPTAS